ncbi:thiamine diphosphokinase [Pelagovum pacificum]|uniref:Thiamine diphosphokinase n=1 Tax=Pelagovum pacificum TaxID=2588711 RepID=A0A5C5G7Q7_9RHOB|nr:thiamine diphosphokinase [Pelagovum pacificum]QQA41851.1 thiamine diphosphokinase [Pelagovum pacificum]TNY30706.1 thiamine diphosphokinase [Pelagovum pacificum]
MIDPIVRSPTPVTLIGGAPARDNELETAVSFAPTVVAVDGGGDHALAAGLWPEAVIGDMDSLTKQGSQALEGRIHRIAEQSTTDFDKALRSIEAPLVIAVGMTGGRLDHELAAMTVLVRHPHRYCIVLGEENVTFVAPPRLTLDLPARDVFSLFPMRRVTGRSDGLRWPLDGLVFTPDDLIGTSNEVTGPVTLAMDDPGMLVILARDALGEVVRTLAALAERDAPRWPAPAR